VGRLKRFGEPFQPFLFVGVLSHSLIYLTDKRATGIELSNTIATIFKYFGFSNIPTFA